jgi:hypothetical protein
MRTCCHPAEASRFAPRTRGGKFGPMGFRLFGRLAAPCMALALAACVSAQSWEAVRVLRDIDAGSGPSALKARTPTPTRTTISYRLDGRTAIADLYQPNQPIGGGLVLVPGFTPHGKDDPRLVDLALSLSRARFLVLVPDLEGSRRLRIRMEDVQAIADAATFLAGEDRLAPHHGVGVAAISYAVALAILATMEARAKDKIAFVVGVGGYHDTTSMVTFMTTGRFKVPTETGWQSARPNPNAGQYGCACRSERPRGAFGRSVASAAEPRRGTGRSGRPSRPGREIGIRPSHQYGC